MPSFHSRRRGRARPGPSLPDSVKTDEVDDLIAWLGAVVHQTDSSLVDEWESLTAPDDGVRRPGDAPAPPPRRLSTDTRAFRVLLRNAMFQRVQLLARRDWAGLAALDAAGDAEGVPLRRGGWAPDDWAEAGNGYYAEHDEVGLGGDARGPALLRVHTAVGDLVEPQIDVPEDGLRRSMCLLDDESGVPFGGDTINTGPIYAQFHDADVATFASSTARLAELKDDVSLVAVNHFGRTTAPPYFLQEVSDAWSASSRVATFPGECHDTGAVGGEGQTSGPRRMHHLRSAFRVRLQNRREVQHLVTRQAFWRFLGAVRSPSVKGSG